ncbi:MAG: divalent-cation tolerance protein CutA [Methylotenera sp.]|jgi:periplasmic divalent cation tolerance protein|uniref:divalent-cation tolerance protein CutA n=1 Tax=Methylotenera sp. TaxID=2051956 RepID=UPI0027188787|nr:divalent-cation tolerance protein CutA [Methylotenera sp.]MDO9151271.1 divalent-cation tolerance protein CutA [Methylotenera sp.]
MSNPENILLVLTNVPDTETASLLAETLITQKLAACVNILSPCQSIYIWEGNVERANEIPMLIKTTQLQYDALQAAIIKAHPYELPEIISINVDGGLHQYLQWVTTQLSA